MRGEMAAHCAFHVSAPQVSPCAATPRWHVAMPVAHDSTKKKGFGSVSPKTHQKSSSSSNKTNFTTTINTDNKKAVVLQEGSEELQRAIKSVEKDYEKKQRRGLRVDKEVAAKGKVDFVKVESWGTEGNNQSELDNLKVKTFSPAFSSSDNSTSFYERLVHRIQLLESKGDISVVQAQSLPPFQEWRFGGERYLQYLIDQHAVFNGLRCSISTLHSSTFNSLDPEEERSDRRVIMAVGIFDESLGLDRSQALHCDIEAFSRTLHERDGGNILEPTTQTIAYVKYLRHLVKLAADAKEQKQGCLRILAHIFAIYVAHLTTGMRIGAKALDCIMILKEAKAVSYYRDYPQHVLDPLKVFIAAINKIPDFVEAQEDQELIMEELPRAIQKTSLLLSVLAVKEDL